MFCCSITNEQLGTLPTGKIRGCPWVSTGFTHATHWQLLQLPMGCFNCSSSPWVISSSAMILLNSAVQCRPLFDLHIWPFEVVDQLEAQMSKERQRLQAMMQHLQMKQSPDTTTPGNGTLALELVSFSPLLLFFAYPVQC